MAREAWQDTGDTLERVGRYERRFEQVDQTLGRVFERFATGVQTHHETVEVFVRDLDTALESAVKTPRRQCRAARRHAARARAAGSSD